MQLGVILPALSLAIVHIAGDNVAVVPAIASLIGNSIYSTVFLSYVIFGSLVAGTSAWIGAKSGRELAVVVKKLFGNQGKILLAIAVLAVSIPASSLTGGYFAGQMLKNLTGIPYTYAVPICIISCALLAAGYGRELLRISNYIALLFIPAAMILLVLQLKSFSLIPSPNLFSFDYISWPLVLALIGYNAGGMRSALVVEAGTYLTAKNYKGVYLAVLAKIFEGSFTLLLAHLALLGETSALMPLPDIADKVFDSWFAFGFNGSLLCVLVNTMVPAMLVNAKQLSVLTNFNFWQALALAVLLVWCGSFVDFKLILMVMSATGLTMIAFIVSVAYALHKHSCNNSK